MQKPLKRGWWLGERLSANGPLRRREPSAIFKHVQTEDNVAGCRDYKCRQGTRISDLKVRTR
jgi:hypothetical protein